MNKEIRLILENQSAMMEVLLYPKMIPVNLIDQRNKIKALLNPKEGPKLQDQTKPALQDTSKSKEE